MINKSRDDFTWIHLYGQFFKGYLKSRVLIGIISDQTAKQHVDKIYQGNICIAHTRTWKRCCIHLATLLASRLKQFSLPAKEISVEKDFVVGRLKLWSHARISPYFSSLKFSPFHTLFLLSLNSKLFNISCVFFLPSKRSLTFLFFFISFATTCMHAYV